MKSLLRTISLIVFCLICIVSQSIFESTCPLTSPTIQTDILTQNPIPCLKKALRHGWQPIITYLTQKLDTLNQEQFIQILQQQVKRLQILQQEIVLGSSETEPILRWGQNKTHVFITFKLSHRWDSPPCLYTQGEKSRLQENRLLYDNVCLVSHQKITFKVHLELWSKVFLSMSNPQQTNTQSWEDQDSVKFEDNKKNQLPKHLKNFTSYRFEVKKDGVGQYSTILLKKQPLIWTFLTREQKLYPVWHEITQRYSQDFKEYQEAVKKYEFQQKQRAFIQKRQKLTNSSYSASQSQLQSQILKGLFIGLIAVLLLCI